MTCSGGGWVKSLEPIGSGPVGLVHRQKVRFFSEEKPHCFALSFSAFGPGPDIPGQCTGHVGSPGPSSTGTVGGKPMDVGAWLRGLGLGQYERTFRDSEIEADILPELTEADLEKIGLPLGPRKRILKAIQNLGDADKTPEVAGLERSVPAKDAGERRQLTVMFCDLVGSTSIS